MRFLERIVFALDGSDDGHVLAVLRCGPKGGVREYRMR